MLLVVTIPALNEQKTIGKVIGEIPKKINGIDKIEILVIDDGSTDNTVSAAKAAGAKVIRNTETKGLAYSFKRGMDKALEMKADIIVNTDADFQYNQKQIPALIKPILDAKADIVLGSRFKGKIEYMPLQKRVGNKIASFVVSLLSGKKISDAQTGFRAFSREAALRMNIISDYTYTQETILQAVDKKLVIKEMPIDFRKREGKSRLISSIFTYAAKVGATILIYYLYYRPLHIFGGIGLFLILLGLITGLRVFLHFIQTGLVSPYIPTAILTALLLIVGLQIIVIGLLAEMIKHNRRIAEEKLYLLKNKGA